MNNIKINLLIIYLVMRFAELMLNYAEEANETVRTAEKITVLKHIHKRAGINAGADENYGLTATDSREQMRTMIMNERNIALCFEGPFS